MQRKLFCGLNCAAALGGAGTASAGDRRCDVLAYRHVHGAARINDIHAEFGHRRSTLTSVLDRLEARGAIKRAPDAENRRSAMISLTAPGGR
jgi:DNA-binding MarR family transcriptional regulator